MTAGEHVAERDLKPSGHVLTYMYYSNQGFHRGRWGLGCVLRNVGAPRRRSLRSLGSELRLAMLRYGGPHYGGPATNTPTNWWC
eukprot:COSAG02_NODE_2824_length_7947_cov_2.690494_5_plen_84_part_00